jgi:hypothetical protein
VKILPNCPPELVNIKFVKVKLVKIENRNGNPNLHFEIDGKMYFYGIEGIESDYKIVLRCQKNLYKSKCNNLSSILPSEFLKQIIHDTSKEQKLDFPKFFNKLDPRVYDIKNYDLNSFEIGNGHKCPGTEIDVYLKNDIPGKYKLVKIGYQRGHPKFHFEINGKYYFYGIRGIKADYKIVLVCTKKSEKGKSKCNNHSTILPSEFLKEIIQNKPKKSNYAKFLNKFDPRVYDIKNYDINSFNINLSNSGEGHKCSGIELEVYSKLDSKPIMIPKEVKCELRQISNSRGHPTFHFEINEKMYLYGLQGIKIDYKMALYCQKPKCSSGISISPLDFLKKIIQNSPYKIKTDEYNAQCFDKSDLLRYVLTDPEVYNIKNYNLLEIGRSHSCLGTELDIYLKINDKPKL